jgi:hypothetical protein
MIEKYSKRVLEAYTTIINNLNLQLKSIIPFSHWFKYPLGILIVYLSLLFLPHSLHFIPDSIGLGHYEHTRDVFDKILDVMSQLLGFAGAFILIAFELFRQKVGSRAYKYFINSKDLSKLITITLSLLLSSFWSKIIIPDNNLSFNHLSIFYFNIYFFIFCLVFLFYYSFKIIASFKIENIIKQEIDKLTNLEFEHYVRDEPYHVFRAFEEDPIVTLSSICMNYIGQDDRLVVQVINNQLVNKIIQLYESTESDFHKRNGINTLKRYFNRIVDYSLNHSNNEVIFENIYKCCEDINKIFSEKKLSIYDLAPINMEFYPTIFEVLFKNNNDRLLRMGVDSMKSIFDIHISSFQEEKHILYVYSAARELYIERYGEYEYSKKDKNLNNRFEYVVNDLFEIFETTLENSIKYKNQDIFEYCVSSMQNLSYNIFTKNVSDLIRALVVVKASNSIFDNSKIALEKGLFMNSSENKSLFFYESKVIRYAINHKSIFLRKLIENYCYYILFIQKNGFMDNRFLAELKDSFIILKNRLVEFSRLFFEQMVGYDEKEPEIYKNCVLDIITTHQFLREEMEKTPEKNKVLHIQLKKSIEDIKEALLWVEKRGKQVPYREEIIEKLDLEISKFSIIKNNSKLTSTSIFKSRNKRIKKF